MEAAEAWATQGDSKSLESLGFLEEDLAYELDIYPENWPVLMAFLALQTQWRVGMGGRTGLIYSEAYAWMDEQGMTRRKKRQDLMQGLRTMEGEALRAWAEQTDRS